jgi:hypothetical protein
VKLALAAAKWSKKRSDKDDFSFEVSDNFLNLFGQEMMV